MYLVAADDKDPVVPLLFAGSLLGTAVYQLCLSAYRARGHVAADAANDVLSRIGVLVVGTVVLGLGAGLVGAAGVYGAADVVSAVVVLWFISTRHSVADDHVAPPDLRIRSTAVLGFAVTIWLVYLRIDGYLVGLLVGSSQAGLYGAAYRFLDVALLPALVLNHTILAHAAPLHGRTRLAEVNRFLRLALVVTVPLCIAGAVLAEPIIHLLFPASFEPAIPIARVLMISAVPGAVAAVLTPLAGVSDRHRFAWAAVFVLVVNVGVDLVVIPRYLAIGAAWATVGCQILLGGLLYEIVRRDCVAKS
jgi:O-antigen/teichoic acid export membrane protein